MNHACTGTLNALAMLLLAGSACGDTLTTFSSGSIAPGTSSYFVSPTMVEAGTYNVVSFDTLHGSWSDFFDHTSGDETGRFMVVNGGSGSGGGMAWGATISVLAGTDYELGAWFASVYGFAVASLKFVVIGDTTLTSGTFTAPGPTGVWEQSTFGFNTGSATSVTVQIWDTTGISDGNDYAIDDITLDVVPGPGGAAVLALGSLLRRGRRRA